MLRKQKIKSLIIHCSDTPDTEDIGAEEIHRMHINFGWDGIGYHKVIRRCGAIENGRPEYWIGAHTYGRNEESLGVCLIGRKTFSDEQYNSLKRVLYDWKKKYQEAVVLGHRDAIKTKKTCPNFDVIQWCKKNKL